MTPAEYQELLVMSAPPHSYGKLVEERLCGPDRIDLLHAQLGISTEAGEFADAIKRYLYYGKDLDRTNLVEELGDLTWYIGLAIGALGTTWGQVFEANIKKLKARYPNKFSEESALNRDLETERNILDDYKPEDI
jgi:NTP pyrophosphatase (non-canonical NTP hydrolase)